MKPPRAKPRRIEDGIQRACAHLLRIYEQQGRLRFFHVPNGGKRSPKEAAIMHGLGVRSGVPDLVILWPFDRGPHLGAWGRAGFIEIKRPDRSAKLSENQKEWRWVLEFMGFPWAELRDPADLADILRKWGVL